MIPNTEHMYPRERFSYDNHGYRQPHQTPNPANRSNVILPRPVVNRGRDDMRGSWTVYPDTDYPPDILAKAYSDPTGHARNDGIEDVDHGRRECQRDFPTHYSGSTHSKRGSGEIKAVDYSQFRRLQKKARTSYRCIIASSVFLAITLAGLIATVVLLLLGPCYHTNCNHGYCDWTGATAGDPVCRCDERYTGILCDKEITVSATQTEISVTWDDVTEDSDQSWVVYYSETPYYPDQQSRYTEGNQTVFNGVKPREPYEIFVYGVDASRQMILLTSDSHTADSYDLTVAWDSNTTLAISEHFVSINRMRRRHSDSFVVTDEQQATINELIDCTNYDIRIVRVMANKREEVIVKFTEKTLCSPAKGWAVGDSVIIFGWSGGANALLSNSHCRQKDSFPLPVNNPSCRSYDGDATGAVGEAITNLAYYTGRQSWHYKRGHSQGAHGVGCPFSPQLAVKAGRSDSNYGGDVDGFYARIYFKAANAAGDGSSIEIAGGDESGDDRTSTMVYITAEQRGVSLVTYDSYWDECREDDTCGHERWYFEVPLVSGLDLQRWHMLEMELHAHNGKYQDRWSYYVNGILTEEVGAYLNAWSLENQGIYNHVNRLKFKPRNDIVDDETKLGFYFDDIYYETFDWKKRDEILDSYTTSFEN